MVELVLPAALVKVGCVGKYKPVVKLGKDLADGAAFKYMAGA